MIAKDFNTLHLSFHLPSFFYVFLANPAKFPKRLEVAMGIERGRPTCPPLPVRSGGRAGTDGNDVVGQGLNKIVDTF
ncbi:MAG: hypothetical protein B6D64_04315 [Bacteroidetes bacterium 4484_276]|nr:MAG: hypothetical protein B6D64_04315 [Bacteroidetes bacterium 4484_276]